MDCSPDTETHCSPRYPDILSFCPDSETAVLSGYRVTLPCPDTESGRYRQTGYRDPSVSRNKVQFCIFSNEESVPISVKIPEPGGGLIPEVNPICSEKLTKKVG